MMIMMRMFVESVAFSLLAIIPFTLLYYKVNNKLKKRVKFAELFCKATELETKYYSIKFNMGFENYPELEKEIARYNVALTKNGINLQEASKEIKITYVSFKDYKSRIKIYTQLDDSPKEVQKLFLEYSSIFSEIYRLNKPIRFYVQRLKKILLLHMLSIGINMVKNIINMVKVVNFLYCYLKKVNKNLNYILQVNLFQNYSNTYKHNNNGIYSTNLK